MDNNKHIIFLKGTSNEFYEQAIFIMRDKRQNKAVNLVEEAEKIIEDYMRRNALEAETGKPKKNVYFTTEKILNICIVISSLLLAATLYTLLV